MVLKNGFSNKSTSNAFPILSIEIDGMDIEAVNTLSEYDKEITIDICPNWKNIYFFQKYSLKGVL